MSAEITRYVRDLIVVPRSPLRSLAALALGVVSLAPPLICFGACAYELFKNDPSLALYPLGLFAAIAALPSLGRRVAAWRQRRMLRIDLTQRLLEAGFAEQDEAPGAQQLRADFWEREQRVALERLRGQLAARSHSEDLFVAMRRAVVQSKVVIAILGVVWGATTLFISYAISPNAMFVDRIGLFLISALYFALSMFYLFSLTGLINLAKERAERRELRRETHRVVNLIDAAGGLSLAEGEVRDLLQGAIEPAGAVGGEVELIEVAGER